MSFFSNKIGIGEDISIEVTCEKVLDSSGNLNLFWSDNGQLGPFTCELIRNPK